MALWFTWTPKGKGGEGQSNPVARRAHTSLENINSHDLRIGAFPLACGRWAPDGWDAEIVQSSAPRCRRCQAALNTDTERTTS